MALGVGTAPVYPTLLAAIGDVAHPSWRASAVGVYRLWRDSGYAIGALIAGVTADLVGLRGAVLIVAVLTAASGLFTARFLTETHNRGVRMARTKFTIRSSLASTPTAPGWKSGSASAATSCSPAYSGGCSRWAPATA